MPEIRHGSLAAGLDPQVSESHASQTSASNPSAATATRPQPVQHASAQSADTAVSGTKQMSAMRRLSHAISGLSSKSDHGPPTGSTDLSDECHKSLSYALREPADVYYDSRAAGRREWKRRARNLQDYYDDNPHLLSQLPFSWHHGKRRWKLWGLAIIAFIDASIVPIVLYYCMKYAGNVPSHIIFAIITTIWGGPAYLEFGIRTLRLLKKENFYRPLGLESRWASNMTTWTGSLTIFVLTALFIIGSAPRHTGLRVVSMAAVSILWCLGGVLLFIHLLHMYKRPAPFRINSTAKGEPVRDHHVAPSPFKISLTDSCVCYRSMQAPITSWRMYSLLTLAVAVPTERLSRRDIRRVPASAKCCTKCPSSGLSQLSL
jgi:hypothetical protein